MSAGPAGARVDTGDAGWERDLAAALGEDRPLALVLRPGAGPHGSLDGWLRGMLRHPMPVTGVLAGRVAPPRASLALACDALLWVRGASLRLQPSGAGEVALLSLRLGRAAATRVWFGGGLLRLAEARKAGWASLATTLEDAITAATSRCDGLSPAALALLRPLLYHQAGLPRGPAEALERAAFALAFASGQPAEGIRAFLEKRKPRFHGGGE